METANYPPFSVCAVFSIALKLLLIPAYKSTDFEVHRNWLAITNSLPLSRWYFEVEKDISEWTLDYPPFFAAFEWCLSQIARFVDPGMLQLRNLGYDSSGTVYFQRISVIVTELFLLLVLIRIASTVPQSASAANHATALSIYLSPGLLIIDHIHFQYNGFLFGLLILSIYFARESRYVSCGLAFASLLCFKHIFLYIAPAYFIFLLRAYCLRTSYPWINVENTIKLGVSVVSVFAIAFGPFVYLGQIPQLLSRLFPFSRGLCHAYWAPNIWAIYSFVDRILIGVAPHFKYRVDKSALNSVTRGLVGDSSFAVLPNITPRMTFLLTLGVQTISLAKLFVQPTYDKFVGSITLCGFASFLFGWHVHEKAILLVIIPFSLLVLKDRRYLGAFRPLAVAGHVSLFPLLFTVAEFPIKTVYTLLWLIVFLSSFDNLAPVFSVVYVIVSVPLIVYTSLFHGIIFGQKYEFLPLMFTSSYSAIGVVGSFVGFLVLYFID